MHSSEYGNLAASEVDVLLARTILRSGRRSARGAAPWLLAGGLAAGLLASGAARATPASFPPVHPWLAALRGGVPLGDPEGDAPGSRDIVGDTASPLLFITADATHLYLRIRLDDSPWNAQMTSFGPFGWGCLVSTDSDPQTYEYSILVDGVSNPDAVLLYRNTSTTAPNSPMEDPDLPAVSAVTGPLAPAVGHASISVAGSSFGGTPDYFVDWVIDLSDAALAGFDPSQPARYYCGSANDGTSIGADCSGGVMSGCPLDGQLTDAIRCDASGCGICGDGVLGGPEECDDRNTAAGDGCSPACEIEIEIECTTDADCDDGEVCDVEPGQCVPGGCQSDLDCPADLFCDLPTGECVECLENSQCPGSVCHLATHTCGCTTDPECGDGHTCDTSTGACEEVPGQPVVEGNGLSCSARGGGPSGGEVPSALLGLVGLSLLRRRRRR